MTTINLYSDLSNVFDSLFHEILLSKLKHYGIRDAALNLIKKFIFKIGNNMSNSILAFLI